MSEDADIIVNDEKVELPPNQGITVKILDPEQIKPNDKILMIIKRGNVMHGVHGHYAIKRQDPSGALEIVPEEEDLGDPEERRQIARMLVEANTEQIKEQSLKAVEAALARKPLSKLKKLAQSNEEIEEKDGKIKKKHKTKITSNRGCVTLSIGNEETIL